MEVEKAIGPTDGRYRQPGRPNLKVQLLEINDLREIPSLEGEGCGDWRRLDDSKHWFICNDAKIYHVMNRVNERIWAFYSLSKVETFKKVTSGLLEGKTGIDNCWLSANQMESIGKGWKKEAVEQRDHSIRSLIEETNEWKRTGMGVKFRDALSKYDSPSSLSIKAWYGVNDSLDRILSSVKADFLVSSIRWKDFETETSSEWYSSGKITFHSTADVDYLLMLVNNVSTRYYDSLKHATEIRDSEIGSFEFNFKQKVNLERYSEVAKKGIKDLKLWLMEVESHDDFKRLQGVDLHTWDRIFLDLGYDYAYMTIPGNGCVNAAPRLVNVQGETVFGNAKITYNGNEVFV